MGTFGQKLLETFRLIRQPGCFPDDYKPKAEGACSSQRQDPCCVILGAVEGGLFPPWPLTHPPAPISQEAALRLVSVIWTCLILSSPRETEASLLSEITTAVGREVWGKYLKKESWEFQLQSSKGPKGGRSGA